MPLLLHLLDRPDPATKWQNLMVIPTPRHTMDSPRVFLENTKTPLEIEGKEGDGNSMVAGF